MNEYGYGRLLTAETDHRCVPLTLFPILAALTPVKGKQRGVVYLLVNAYGEDIPIPKRLFTQHQSMVELLDGLVSPGSTVRIGEADQLSTPRMQLRRHLVGGQCLRHPDFTTITPQKTAIFWYRTLLGN